MKTHITIYSYGGIPGPCLNTTMDLIRNISDNKRHCVVRNVRDDALISRSRSRETAMAVDSGSDVWMQLDHDITYEPDDLFRMCEIALEKNAAVCAAYSCRALPARSALRPVGNQTITEVGDDRLVPITFFASGFVAIPIAKLMDAIELCSTDKVPEEYRVKWITDAKTPSFKMQYPSFWRPMIVETSDGAYEYLSEDYSASARLRVAGVEQLAWTKPLLQHWGDFPYMIKPIENTK